MEKFPIIDADGHVTESNESLRKHLKKEYRNRPLMHSEAWDRSFGGTLGKRNEEPKTQLADMDVEGIDVQVIFPSHLSLNAEKETDLATDIARAYNDWLAEFCATDQGGSRVWRWWHFRISMRRSAKCAAPLSSSASSAS